MAKDSVLWSRILAKAQIEQKLAQLTELNAGLHGYLTSVCVPARHREGQRSAERPTHLSLGPVASRLWWLPLSADVAGVEIPRNTIAHGANTLGPFGRHTEPR